MTLYFYIEPLDRPPAGDSTFLVVPRKRPLAPSQSSGPHGRCDARLDENRRRLAQRGLRRRRSPRPVALLPGPAFHAVHLRADS